MTLLVVRTHRHTGLVMAVNLPFAAEYIDSIFAQMINKSVEGYQHDEGLNIDCTDINGRNIISQLLIHGNYSLAKHLIEKHRARIDYKEPCYTYTADDGHPPFFFFQNPIIVLMEQLYGNYTRETQQAAREFFLSLIADKRVKVKVREYTLAIVFNRAFNSNDLHMCIKILKSGLHLAITQDLKACQDPIPHSSRFSPMTGDDFIEEDCSLQADPVLHQESKICYQRLIARINFAPEAAILSFLHSKRLRECFGYWDFSYVLAMIPSYSRRINNKKWILWENIGELYNGLQQQRQALTFTPMQTEETFAATIRPYKQDDQLSTYSLCRHSY